MHVNGPYSHIYLAGSLVWSRGCWGRGWDCVWGQMRVPGPFGRWESELAQSASSGRSSEIPDPAQSATFWLYEEERQVNPGLRFFLIIISRRWYYLLHSIRRLSEVLRAKAILSRLTHSHRWVNVRGHYCCWSSLISGQHSHRRWAAR